MPKEHSGGDDRWEMIEDVAASSAADGVEEVEKMEEKRAEETAEKSDGTRSVPAALSRIDDVATGDRVRMRMIEHKLADLNIRYEIPGDLLIASHITPRMIDEFWKQSRGMDRRSDRAAHMTRQLEAANQLGPVESP